MSLKALTNDPNKRYFIFDTGVTHEDIDFKQYSWERSRFDKVRTGDYFIYRRPQRASENKKFYFFGIGQIASIEGDGDQVKGIVENPVRFTDIIYQDEINNYKWIWKEKTRNDWQYFFNIYGMNLIPFEDFENFCRLGIGNLKDVDFSVKNKEYVKSHIDLLNVKSDNKDRWAMQKTRGYQQKVFSDNLRTVYQNKCCITGISTRDLLHGAHINPHSKDRLNRSNIKNGLLLSLIVHKCFDEGLISIDDEYKMILCDNILDKELLKYLKKYEGKKINLPVRREYYPDKIFLKNHREKFKLEI